jgi:hypothetical protein
MLRFVGTVACLGFKLAGVGLVIGMFVVGTAYQAMQTTPPPSSEEDLASA